MQTTTHDSLPSATLLLVRHGDSRAVEGSLDRYTPLSDWQSDMPILTASITELGYWPSGRIALART